MLKVDAKRESLAGKLLLSSAMVAVSLAYGWWQPRDAGTPTLAIPPMPVQPAPGKIARLPRAPAAPATDTAPGPQNNDATAGAKDAPAKEAPSPAAPPKDTTLAQAAPQPAAPMAQPQQTPDAAPSPPSALTQQQAMQMNLPTEGTSPPLALVTGSPDPGVTAALPAGEHLEDGEYVSGKHQLMWGDLKIKISIHGGVITGVQALDFPDHRSQSLYLSQMALPILESEVIKGQKSQVDTVSSATDTSYTFQDAVADAIISATRG
jgi:uncharacterized protein with FMN-binding domain